MKKSTYENAEIKVVLLDAGDVIVTSGWLGEDDEVTDWEKPVN